MARGNLSETERHCFDNGAKSQSDRLHDSEKMQNGVFKSNGLRVRFLDEEGKTERMVSADEFDYTTSPRVKKIHILKNRSSSETSILLRHPSLMKRRSSDHCLVDGNTDNLNNNSLNENLNGKVSILKINDYDEHEKTEIDMEQTKESSQHFKKNCNVYSVDQAKTLTPEKKKGTTIPKRIASKMNESHSKSFLPAEVCLADGVTGKDFTARTIGRLSKGLGRLLRRTNSVRISEPDPTYKVAYLGNVLTAWARGESCIEKPLATLWRNYQQSTKPDVVMKLSVTNSGLKGFTKEHGLTEYWSHRVTYCASPPHYPKLFCWVYRHEGKKLKHELRCHAVLCTKEAVSKNITEELKIKLKQALVEFKKDRISKQNARLSLANSVYDNPSMPRRKILLSVGALNYRPPLERSKSAPKLGAIEEQCSEEDEEEAEMSTKNDLCDSWIHNSMNTSKTLDRRRPEYKSPRKFSCPEGIMDRYRQIPEESLITNQVIDMLVEDSKKNKMNAPSHSEVVSRLTLEAIAEANELTENKRKDMKLISQSNFLVIDSDDGSVSSGCETASTVTSSDAEPSSLPSQFPQDEIIKEIICENEITPEFQEIRKFSSENIEVSNSCANSIDFFTEENNPVADDEVNHIPIGENNFRRRSTYPPLGTETNILTDLEEKYESLIGKLTDDNNLNFSENINNEVFKNIGDNDSACSDESGYSELLDGKDSIIGNTIMV